MVRIEEREIGRFELNEVQARQWAHNGLVLLGISLPVFLFLPLLSGRGLGWVWHWYTIPLCAGLIVLFFSVHELIHGTVIMIFGAKPRYTWGIKAGVPYLATTTDSLLPLQRYKIVALAPVTLISTAGVAVIVLFPFSTLWLALPLAIHTSGAIGDLTVVNLLKRYPKSSLIKDDLTGFTVYTANPGKHG